MDENGLTESRGWMRPQIVGEYLDKNGSGNNGCGQGKFGRGQIIRLLLTGGGRFKGGGNIQTGTTMAVRIKMVGLVFTMLGMMIRAGLQLTLFRTAGTGAGIFQSGTAILAQAPDITLHAGLPGQQQDQQADKRQQISGRRRFH